MIKLYGIPVSNNIAKVRYVLNYLGLEYEMVPTSPMDGSNQTEEYLQISPTGKIPGIDIDGFKLFESSAIIRYLATIHQSDLYPTDPKQRAIVDAWSDYGSIHVAQAQGRVTFNRVLAPTMGMPVDESSLQTGLEFLNKYFPIIDRQLSKTKYLAGDSLTLADINLLAIMDPFEISQISLEGYDNIKKWRSDLISQDFYQKCYPDFTEFLQKAMSEMMAK